MTEKTTYVFDVQDAEAYGVPEAIMLYNIRYWVRVNAANGKNLHNGKFWTYNSRTAFARLFPFWSDEQIKRILKSLKEQGVIEDGCFNRDPFDKTKWYTVTDSMVGSSYPPDWVESTNVDWVEPTNHYTDINKDKNNTSLPLGGLPEKMPNLKESVSSTLMDSVREVFGYWQEVMGKARAKMDTKRRSLIISRLNDYSVAELKAAIDGCKASEYHMGKNDRNKVYNDIELILRDAKHIEDFGASAAPSEGSERYRKMMAAIKGA